MFGGWYSRKISTNQSAPRQAKPRRGRRNDRGASVSEASVPEYIGQDSQSDDGGAALQAHSQRCSDCEKKTHNFRIEKDELLRKLEEAEEDRKKQEQTLNAEFERKTHEYGKEIQNSRSEKDELLSKLEEAEAGRKKQEKTLNAMFDRRILECEKKIQNYRSQKNELLRKLDEAEADRKKQEQTLHAEIEGRNHEYEKYVRHLKGEIQHRENILHMQEDSFRKEKEHQQGELDSLQALYVKSVNTIGTGLEPICDSEFKERFNAIHGKLNGWCRKAFVSKGKVKTRAEIDNGLLLYLSKKLHETDVLNHGQLMDLLAWSYLETEIFPGWFAVTHNWTNSLKDVETHLRCNDSEVANEKTDYWRAYTASLLFQHPDTQKKIGSSAEFVSQDLLDNVLVKLQSGEVKLHPESFGHLVKIFESAIILAAELKCQRACYEIESGIVPGVRYDKSRMRDVGGEADDEDDESSWIVTCVLSKGWIKRPFHGSSDGPVRICKARVLVTNHPELGDTEL